MGSYFKHFTIPFIIVGIITVVSLGIYSSHKVSYERDNTETDLTSNVFNYAGNLSDSSVAKLEASIAEAEEITGCDIALITLDETLEDYVKPYESITGQQPTEKWVMVYADNFADEHAMGYEAPHGNSIVIIDNLYREPSSGHVHSWISTRGLAQSKLSQSDCENIMDDAYYSLTDDSSESDYYEAYARVLELIPNYMGSTPAIDFKYVLLFALVVAVIYVAVNLRSKVGKKTTVSNTYVAGGKPIMKARTDQFINKTVTKRAIQTSSGGSGGSGGHTSAGGFSHGGGGHSR